MFDIKKRGTFIQEIVQGLHMDELGAKKSKIPAVFENIFHQYSVFAEKNTILALNNNKVFLFNFFFEEV